MSLKALKAEASRLRCAEHPDSPLTVRTPASKPLLWCVECGKPPDSTIEATGVFKRWARGEPVSAAVDSKLKRKHGMTEEQAVTVAETRVKPPDWAPSGAELKAITSLFSGWGEVDRATAYGLWSLVNMGFRPGHIHLLGGRPYVNTDGMISHAHEVARREGRPRWRIIFREVTDESERNVAGATRADLLCLKAVYQEREEITVRHPDGTVETRREWVDIDEDYGKASTNPNDTYIKTKGRNQPVEAQFPSEMARSRGTRRVLRKQFGIDMPPQTWHAEEESETASVEAIGAPDDLPYGQPEGDAIEDVEPETVEAQELPWEEGESQ